MLKSSPAGYGRIRGSAGIRWNTWSLSLPARLFSPAGLVVLACILLVSCSKPGGPAVPAIPTGGKVSWAAGEVDRGLSEGPVTYYRAALRGGTVPTGAAGSSPGPSVLPGGDNSGAAGNKESAGGAFTIVDFGPRDELPAAIGRPSVYVVFSKPVVPLSELGATMTSTPLMKIEPHPRGLYRWYGSRMLAFEAADEILSQRLYTVSLAKDMRALDGSRLEGATSFSFHTEYLAMRELIPGDISHARPDYGEGYVDESAMTDIPPDRAGDFLIRFNYAVDPAIVGKSLDLTAGGRRMPFSLSRPPAAKEGFAYRDGIDRYLRVKLRQVPPFNEDLLVTLRAGAKSAYGLLGSEKERSLSFHTLLPFGYSEYSEQSWEFDDDEVPDRNPLFLSFSHPVKPESLAGAVTLSPGPTIPASAISVHGGTVRLNDLSLASGSEYRLTLAAGISDIYGRKLGQAVEVKVKTRPDRAYVEFPDSGTRMLEAGQAPRIVFSMKNMVSGGLSVAPAGDPYGTTRPDQLPPYDMSGVKPRLRRFGMIDLAPWLGAGGTGTVGIDWSFRPAGPKPKDWKGSLIVQVTDLGLTLRYAYNRAVCLVTKLSSGLPVSGAVVTLMGDRVPVRSGKTDSRGLAVFSLAPGEYRSSFIRTKPGSGAAGSDEGDDWRNGWRNGTRDALRIRVESGTDRIEFVPNESHDMYSGPVQATETIAEVEKPRQVAFLFSDRKIYRPGEELGFRGIDRDLSLGRYSPYRGPWTIHLMPPEWDAKPIMTLRGTASELGGFYGTFVLPAEAEPGEYSILYERGSGSYGEDGKPAEGFSDRSQVREWITVARFRKQLFSVSAGTPAKTSLAGDPLAVNFSASYLSGGALAGAAWDAYWTREPAWFDFGPAWSEFAFGPGTEGTRSTLDEKSGTLSANGEGSHSISTSARDAAGRPWTYTFNLNVSDTTSGRLVGASRNIFVHPASLAIGLRLKGSAGPWFAVAEKGVPAAFEAVLIDPEGKEYGGSAGRKASVEIAKIEWKVARQQGAASRIHTRYERVESPYGSFKVDIPRAASAAVSGAAPEPTPGPGATGAGRPAAFSFTPDSAGEYLVRISTRDASGREAVTALPVYVTGSGYARWNPERSEAIDLKPDRQLYLPGETAKLLIRSPLPAGRYLLTVEREGIFEERVVELAGSTSTVDIPIREEYLPIVYVSLSSYTVRTAPAATKWGEPDLDKPKGLFGLAALAVDSPSRRIFLTVEPDRASYLPGSKATVTVTASDSAGRPIQGAEVSFMAADRGVLDLVDYHVPDPHAHFYAPWNFPLATMGADSRSLLLDPVTYELKDLQGGAGDNGKAGEERSDFRSTAVFLPFLKTDARGKAVASFPWPDSLTTWRCTAIAADTDRFGIVESEIQVRNPVNAVALMPELLRLRDTVSAGLMITNLEKTDRRVSVSCSSDLLFAAEGGKEKSVLVKPGESARLEFRLMATKEGAGNVRYSVHTEGFSETLAQSVTVEGPRTFESVSLIGSTKEKAEEGLVLPARDFGPGSLDIVLSRSLLPALGGAFSYLFTYPYGCIEQRVSALEPLVLFGDRAQKYGIDSRVRGPRAVVDEGLAFIAKRQLPGGGFPYWPDGTTPNRYVSIRVAHLFFEAKERGFAVPETVDTRALLAWVASSPGRKGTQPGSTAGRDYLFAYADYVLSLYGFDVRARLEGILKDGANGGIVPYAFAGLALAASGDRDSAGRVFSSIRNYLVPSLRGVDLTDPAPVTSSWYSEAASDTDAMSLVLMLSRAIDPESELTGKLARTLLSSQAGGYWRSTAETVWALRALSLVIDDEERAAFATAPATAPAPSGIAGGSVAAGGKILLETTFGEGPSSALHLALDESPLRELPRGMTLPLDFRSPGGLPLHYAATLRYSLPEELALPRDEGLGVFTEVLSLDGKPADRSRLTEGSLYRMKIVVSSPRDRSFVALRVPVASGCEILDSRFVTTARVKEKPRAGGEADGGQVENPDAWVPEALQSIFDNEVRYFIDFFEKGQREMEFVFRAGTAGTFPVPPAVAECMYEPEFFGRGAGGVTVIGEGTRR